MIASSDLRKKNPAPGKLVDVGGYRMHLYCTGQGSPTVILEAGVNDFSIFWSEVQPEIARATRVCSYDRAGLGWSEASPRPRTNQVMVEELHALLTNTGIAAPYVLVGHSFGGINMRLFAHQYPDEVLGMVLVDSAHEQQSTRFPYLRKATDRLMSQFRMLSAMRSLGWVALVPKSIPNPGLPPRAYQQYQALLASTDYFNGALAEASMFYSSGGYPPSSLEDLPLIVLCHGRPESVPGLTTSEERQFEQGWQRAQLELAALSTRSRQVIATRSSHYIQLDQPELVIQAVQEMVSTVGANQAGRLEAAR